MTKNKKPAIAYPGSLIQQNHSEPMNHGFLVWDTNTKKSEFITVDNEYLFYTVDADNPNWKIPNKIKGKNVRLRVQYKHATSARLKEVIAEIKTYCNVLQIAMQKERLPKSATLSSTTASSAQIADIQDSEIQLNLILDFLQPLSVAETEEIRKIHNNFKKDNFSKLNNAMYKPISLEFSNLFSYGEGNYIDFTNIRGIYGLFGANATGKTSLLDTLTFTIFDKCSKTSKGSHIINSSSDTFYTKHVFKIDDKLHVIEKNGIRKGEDKVSVEIDFYTFDSDDNKVSLNGKERSDTNNNIRALLGNYEEFVLTTLSVQNNSGGFIDMSQRERKDLLAQFLNVNVFDGLNKQAIDEGKETVGQIKLLRKKDHVKLISDANKAIQSAETQLTELAALKFRYDYERGDLRNKIETVSLQINKNIENFDINQLQSDRRKTENQIAQLKDDLSTFDANVLKIEAKREEIETALNQFNVDAINENLKKYDMCLKDLAKLEKDLAKIETDLRHREKKIATLANLEYDENCSYCMNNVFVKDAIETKESFTAAKQRHDALELQIGKLRQTIADLAEWQTEKDNYQKLLNNKQKLKELEQKNVIDNNAKIQQQSNLVNRLLKIDSDIVRYNEIQKQIIENQTLTNELTSLKTQLSETDLLHRKVDAQLLNLNSSVLLNKKMKNDAETELIELNHLELASKCLGLYQDATNRDGVPYTLIAKSLPEIEAEINNILSQIVEFKILMNCDGKNVNAYIVYDDERFWALELGSGMEKFIASLAIRTALINQTTLTRANFLAIDEGFGVLDNTNLNQVFQLFDYLTTQFDFLLIVSHLNIMRDVVDEIIDINKIHGKSLIKFG